MLPEAIVWHGIRAVESDGVTSVPSIVLAATAQAQAIMLGARAAAKAAAAVDVWPSEGCLPVKKQRTEDLASQSQHLLPRCQPGVALHGNARAYPRDIAI